MQISPLLSFCSTGTTAFGNTTRTCKKSYLPCAMPSCEQQNNFNQNKGTTLVSGGIQIALFCHNANSSFPARYTLSGRSCQLEYNQFFFAAKNSLDFHVFLSCTIQGPFGTQILTGVLLLKDMRHQCFKDAAERGHSPAARDATHFIIQNPQIKSLLLGIYALVK